MRLEAKNVSFRYGKNMPWVLENVDFCVEQGACVGLSAPSGSGKSTLAMLLAGYLRPTEGGILLDGRPLPHSGRCPVQLIYQHPEQAVDPGWRLRRVLEESGRCGRTCSVGSASSARGWSAFPGSCRAVSCSASAWRGH